MRAEWRTALRTEWRAESMAASMTEDRTHEFRWRVAAPGGRWREEKKDNSMGDRRPDDWPGYHSPKLARFVCSQPPKPDTAVSLIRHT